MVKCLAVLRMPAQNLVEPAASLQDGWVHNGIRQAQVSMNTNSRFLITVLSVISENGNRPEFTYSASAHEAWL